LRSSDFDLRGALYRTIDGITFSANICIWSSSSCNPFAAK
jgi:hypothetical protein